MKQIKTLILAVVASLTAPARTMANEGTDFKGMVYKLLGLKDTDGDDMVNERYKKCMDEEMPAEDKAMMNATNEAVTVLKGANVTVTASDPTSVIVLAANTAKTATTQAATEKARADKAEADLASANAKLATDVAAETAKVTAANTKFSGERTARVKLLLDQKVTAGHITGAERTAFEAEFANEVTFDATLAKVEAKKGTTLPQQRQAGMVNIGSRQQSPVTAKRQEKVAAMVNEEMKKPVYANLPGDVKYSKAFAAVQAENPTLWEATT